MKKISFKLITAILTVLICMNSIFPHFSLVLAAQEMGADYYKGKIKELVDYKMRKKAEKIIADNPGISRDDAITKLGNYVQYLYENYTIEYETWGDEYTLEEYMEDYPEGYADATTRAYATALYKNIQTEYLNWGAGTEQYRTGIYLLYDYLTDVCISGITHPEVEDYITAAMSGSPTPTPISPTDLPTPPKPYGGEGTTLESELYEWLTDMLEKYPTTKEKFAFMSEIETKLDANDISFLEEYFENYESMNKDMTIYYLKEFIDQKRGELGISLDRANQMLQSLLAEEYNKKEEELKTQDLDKETKKAKLQEYFTTLKDDFQAARGEFYTKVIEIADMIANDTDRQTFLSGVADAIMNYIRNATGEEYTTADSVLSLFSVAGDAVAGIATYLFKLLMIIVPGAILQMVGSLVAQIGNEGAFQILTLDKIFFNKLPIIDIGVFNMDTAAGVPIASANNPLRIIRYNVATWYSSIRLLCIALAAAVLVYIGIRMLLSNLVEERTKYKKMLKDWIVGFALLFVLHYIIIFTIYLNNGLVDILDKARERQESKYTIELDLVVGSVDTGQTTDLQTRILTEAFSPMFTKGMVSAILYVMLVAMTMLFLIVYIKRFITLCFLVIISPIITVTYSIDKAGDGRAQALGKWFKEFVFNILIQPFHCIIYMVFLQNLFLVIDSTKGILQFGKIFVAMIMLGFMYKSENIVKEIFGFETKSLGSAAIIGAAMLSRVQKAGSRVAMAAKGVKGGKNALGKAKDIKNIKTPDKLPSQAKNGKAVPKPQQQQKPQQTGNGDNKKKNTWGDELKRNFKANTGKTARRLAGKVVAASVGYGVTGEGTAAYGAAKSYDSTKKSIDNARLRHAMDGKTERMLDAYDDYANHKGLTTRDDRVNEMNRLLSADPNTLTDPAEKNMAEWLQADMEAQRIAGAKDPKKSVMNHIKDYEDGLS